MLNTTTLSGTKSTIGEITSSSSPSQPQSQSLQSITTQKAHVSSSSSSQLQSESRTKTWPVGILKGGHTYKQRKRTQGTRVNNIINISTPIPIINTDNTTSTPEIQQPPLNIIKATTIKKRVLHAVNHTPEIIATEKSTTTSSNTDNSNIDFSGLEDFVLSRIKATKNNDRNIIRGTQKMIKLGRIHTSRNQSNDNKFQIKMTVFTRKSRKIWTEKQRAELRTHTRDKIIEWFNTHYPQLLLNYTVMDDTLLYDIYELITFLQPIDISREIIIESQPDIIIDQPINQSEPLFSI